MNEELNLYELEDSVLERILTMEEKERTLYIHHLIEKYFPNTIPNSDAYGDLQLSYRASFRLEKLYRSDPLFHETFTLVYTRHGLVRDAVNDMYFTDDYLITH